MGSGNYFCQLDRLGGLTSPSQQRRLVQSFPINAETHIKVNPFYSDEADVIQDRASCPPPIKSLDHNDEDFVNIVGDDEKGEGVAVSLDGDNNCDDQVSTLGCLAST